MENKSTFCYYCWLHIVCQWVHLSSVLTEVGPAIWCTNITLYISTVCDNMMSVTEDLGRYVTHLISQAYLSV